MVIELDKGLIACFIFVLYPLGGKYKVFKFLIGSQISRFFLTVKYAI